MTNEDKAMLQEAKDFAEKLKPLRPRSIQAASFGKWKLPFKAAMIRDLLLYRTIDLVDAAINLFDKKNVIPALILTRSIVETFSLLFALHEKIEKFLESETKDISELDKFLMASSVGAKKKLFDDSIIALNVLGHIDRFEKVAPGFRDNYDNLSEFAHPNWAGAWGVYGTTIGEPAELILGTRVDMPGLSAGLSVLSSSLGLFEIYYAETGQMIQKLNGYFQTQ